MAEGVDTGGNRVGSGIGGERPWCAGLPEVAM